jgi:D-glycero-D-manno-heptose 1,7-bisphosphate phosphatase
MNRAVFIDRDGVITDFGDYSLEKRDFLIRKQDIRFFPKTAEAIRLLNQANIEVIVVTNQPQIAMGIITEENANEINEEISRQLREQGAKIDAFYYCPHHPKGIIEKYSFECDCRKPKPGLLFKASKERGINLSESYMVGDRIADIKAGNLAGCKKTIGVRTGYACDDGFKDAVPDEIVDTFYDASQKIAGGDK